MKSYIACMLLCFPMKNIKLSTRIKFSLAAFFLCMMAMLLFFNRDEIFWEMLKKKNCDVAVYDFAGKNAMPFVARFFYQKSKNKFLISKFGENEKVAAEFLGWPLQEGDLAWCIWSGNTLTENDFELLARKLDLDTGFEIFRYVYGNNEHKLSLFFNREESVNFQTVKNAIP